MTATIELNDRLVKKAKKISGISNDTELICMLLEDYIHGEELLKTVTKAKAAIGDSNPFWDDYNPRG